jgi:hypothetical protein
MDESALLTARLAWITDFIESDPELKKRYEMWMDAKIAELEDDG